MDDSPDIVTELFAERRIDARPRATGAARVRDLTEADLQAPRPIAGPYQIKNIRASHHALAKCLAAGMKAPQAALVTGYTPVRINQLCQDPAFKALLADYQTEARNIFADMTERMKNVSLDALDHLQERLAETPEQFSIPLLLDVVKTFADRTGHGPNQEVNLNVRATGDLIDRPPRETHEEWKARRERELAAERASLEPPTGPPN